MYARLVMLDCLVILVVNFCLGLVGKIAWLMMYDLSVCLSCMFIGLSRLLYCLSLSWFHL
jgi:hypothetical protein